jgi:hypothetical protein
MRANIYIRKENECVWASITDKSDYVNKFLDAIRKDAAEPRLPDGSKGFVIEFKKKSGAKATSPFMENLVTPDEARDIAKASDKEILGIIKPHGTLSQVVGLCKVHGIPLDSRGRCMQKGCKYA